MRLPRRNNVLRVLLLGGFLYALTVLSYSALRVHSTQSPPAAQLRGGFLDSVRSAFGRRTPGQRQADAHALQVGVIPWGDTAERRLTCIGWRATGDCSPDGPRLPEFDRPCTKTVPHGQSGYCELQDEDTRELFKVARRTCGDAVGKAALFRCLEAPRFANFHVLVQEVVQRALKPEFVLPNVRSDEHETQEGIVMVVYPKMVPSTYATIRVLREMLHCRLPIEIWFLPDEMRKVTASIDPLRQLKANNSIGDIIFREITDPQAIKFATKVYAVYHSAFDRVLFLDSDNAPVRDPSFLFQTPEFVDTGAVFWPDFWHPKHTLFYVGKDSMLWELLNMPFVDMFEQESGQLLIDRRRHAASIELLHFFTFHRPNPFVQLKLVWGDKDLFRLAWLKLGAPFHMIKSPPAVAGKAVNRSFCGMTMVQHDAQGGILFLRRNSHKLTGGRIKNPVDEKFKEIREKTSTDNENKSVLITGMASNYPDAAIWTHVLSFRTTSPLRVSDTDLPR
ncbi:unnamed protein product [Phytophthora fragariaefolia]|uniref:Unnamed protein product n=1 Tax=Phytophthora fragariaefolia TaxID=1490495 RepID=A0A9W6XPF4_9STRA|nr:unnamed protein product [Phytophthora fragariaefolia]